ncbi:hypothetical protein POM88_014733 [Heracleum sosnowskyi]|uniref:Uncharacterized protein n=1 Tax=Heracleum sosnowskyi TaxID=360622 RepID=A0AAD8IIV5_9APIA|nr:hypothetical protein POM88_014733 [Heracleum sosnowskyi]
MGDLGLGVFEEERHQYTSPLVEVVVSSLYKVREDASEWEVGGWKQELVNCGEYLGLRLVCVTEHMITFPTVFKIVHVGENENCVGGPKLHVIFGVILCKHHTGTQESTCVILEWTTTSGRIGVRTAKEPCLTAPSSTKAYNWTSENVPDKKSAQWM